MQSSDNVTFVVARREVQGRALALRGLFRAELTVDYGPHILCGVAQVCLLITSCVEGEGGIFELIYIPVSVVGPFVTFYRGLELTRA